MHDINGLIGMYRSHCYHSEKSNIWDKWAEECEKAFRVFISTGDFKLSRKMVREFFDKNKADYDIKELDKK